MSIFHADSPLVSKLLPSPNHDARSHGAPPDILLLHYTGMTSTDAALARLCDPAAKVSCHYLVVEDGRVVQLVPESRRAWHAGVSSWERTTDINSRSIGIEIGNPGHEFGYPEFPERQITTTIALCRDIVARHAIRADRVLAHSDVAPGRKQDPGEKFPWDRLHRAGVGMWVEPAPSDDDGAAFARGDSGAGVQELQMKLAAYGYGIEPSGQYDQATEQVVAAFQRHFRPSRVDGVADRSSRDTLQRLLTAKAAFG